VTTEPQPVPTPSAPAPAPLPGASPADGSWQAGHEPAGAAPGAPPTPAAPPAPPAPAALQHHQLKRTRISGLWVAVGFFAVILLLLLIFILQNGTTVQIAYFGAHGRLPLGVAMLLSAVCGVLLVVLAGAARISQLRTTARRHRRIDARRAPAPGTAVSGTAGSGSASAGSAAPGSGPGR
jgi:uncharacterized integral membrane protein